MIVTLRVLYRYFSTSIYILKSKSHFISLQAMEEKFAQKSAKPNAYIESVRCSLRNDV